MAKCRETTDMSVGQHEAICETFCGSQQRASRQTISTRAGSQSDLKNSGWSTCSTGRQRHFVAAGFRVFGFVRDFGGFFGLLGLDSGRGGFLLICVTMQMIAPVFRAVKCDW